MSLQWYAIISKINTRDKFLKEIKKSPPKSYVRSIKDVIIYDFESDNIDARSDFISDEDSLLKGYALIKLDSKSLGLAVKDIESAKIGRFIGLNPKGLPYPVPKDQVNKFKNGVKHKREKFRVGDRVVITDGMLKGFDGVIVKRNKLMFGVKVQLPNSTIVHSINIMSLQRHK